MDFTQGTETTQDGTYVASQLAGFLGNFIIIFSEVEHKNLDITGEFYAEVAVANEYGVKYAKTLGLTSSDLSTLKRYLSQCCSLGFTDKYFKNPS
ncbi:hypothetical protein K437DRAFT_265567 [Tilletiaria anomala UBC 951]|uniref:Uncharacterized protein n=1 Tax=Tilletiaria anomala (strain ATCC 24038 / CBS 436.72 / UBC 951) TaxID=1037660 RepID=A0A066WHM1_TILAU|nr:uncharacterized protein K437DRAFT_265567 [Tilletiaria anomala UBC 951]KDN53497.1 hypothetical protein K437DRAFT_265567 [Tilletiaria anomala UBC 951]